VGAVDLAVDVPCIYKEHLVLSVSVFLTHIQEPQSARESHGVEEVGANGDHNTTARPLISSRRISSSEARASAAEFTMTKPALPLLLLNLNYLDLKSSLVD